MSVGVYMLTRDRLEYTKRAITSFRKYNGSEVFLVVIDNGSKDGTTEWLKEQLSSGVINHLHLEPENVGIHKAFFIAKGIFKNKYSLIVKVDNDCEFIEPVIAHIFSNYSTAINYKMVLSPHVNGIMNQPKRSYFVKTSLGDTFGNTGHVGGLCMAIPFQLWRKLEIDGTKPKARGFDSSVCEQAKMYGYVVGYIENIFVEHMDGTNKQAEKYPEYFKRKKIEEVESCQE